MKITLKQIEKQAKKIINDDSWVNDSHTKSEHNGIKEGLAMLVKHFKELESN